MVRESNFEEELRQCEKVLEIGPGNSKALSRRGQARFGLKDYDVALQDLCLLRERQLGDKSVLAEHLTS